MGATLQTVEALGQLQTSCQLLTLIPPHPSKVRKEARASIERVGLPIFITGIRPLVVFQKAALEGIPVNAVKGDEYAGIAWRCYREVGQEIVQ
jgi:chromosome partitioning protein